jgi:hypothetical protein
MYLWITTLMRIAGTHEQGMPRQQWLALVSLGGVCRDDTPSVPPRKYRLELNPEFDFWESDADGTADQANVRRG